MKKKLMTREMALGLILILFISLLSIYTNFNSTSGIYSFMLDVSPTIIGAIALSILIITGNIDISAGTIMGFVAFTAGILSKSGYPVYFYVPAALLVGMGLAGLNGFLSVHFKVPSIVVTLAMNMVHLGFYATFLPNAGWVENLGENFTWFGRARLFGIIPYIFIVALIVAFVFILFMRYSSFSKALYAVGGNKQASIYAGINPERTVINAFLIEGVLLGIAGILKATTTNEIMPSSFQGREMIYIASAVVGGVSILGGSGKVIGSVLGGMLVYLMSITIIYVGFQDYYQFALQGVIILIAVFITVTDFNEIKLKIRRKLS